MSDDGLPWGYVHPVEGWLPLPKGPGLIDLGPPPFDVTLLDGRVRRVVHKPGGSADAATPPAMDAPDASDLPDAP
jgi:hypothetical protein